jgi:hypothetical protein
MQHSIKILRVLRFYISLYFLAQAFQIDKERTTSLSIYAN